MQKQKTFLPAGLFILLVVSILLDGCAGHRKALEKAVEYESAGLYVKAAESDLKSLDKKPDFAPALSHLQKIAPLAYREALDQAQSLEAGARWLEAVERYEALESLLKRCRQYDVVFETIDLLRKLAETREKGAAYYYTIADSAYKTGNFQLAIAQFRRVQTLLGNYLDTYEKLQKSHIAQGNRELENERFQLAIENFQDAARFGLNEQESETHLAETWYRWGNTLFAEEKYREALEKYEHAESLLPNYKDVAEKADLAYQKAVRVVVILPFDNETDTRSEFSDYLADEIRDRCIGADLKFAEFLDFRETDRFIDDYRLRRFGQIDERQALEAAEREGFDALLVGAITEIAVKSTEPSHEEKSLRRKVTKRDSTGKKIEVTETAYYRKYTATHTLKISAYYRILELENGWRGNRQYCGDERSYTARWIRYQGSIYDLPEKERSLLDVSEHPEFAGKDYDEILQSIARQISRQVERQFR